MEAKFNTTLPIKEKSSVVGKLSGFNIWTSVLDRQELFRMSIGCGDETGDLLGWRDLKYLISGVVTIVKTASCKYGEGKSSLNIYIQVATKRSDDPYHSVKTIH